MYQVTPREYDYDKEHDEARTRVEAFDKIDGSKDRELGTILAALDTGLRQDVAYAFDALVMLEDLVLPHKLRL